MLLTPAQRKGLLHLLVLGIFLGLVKGGGWLFRPHPSVMDFTTLVSLFRQRYDSLQVVVSGTNSGRYMPESPASLLPHSININTATEAELVRLPRIGPAIARRIIAYRKRVGKFQTVDELLKIKGIGPKTLQRIRVYLIVQ